jgi:predicted RND superfamily exporter protein
VNIFEHTLNFALRWPKLSSLFFISLLVILTLGLSRTRFELDLYERLDENFSSSVNLAQMREKFEDVNSVHFVMTGKDHPLSASEVCRLESFFRHFSNHDIRVQSWLSPWKLRHVISTQDKILFPTLLPDPCGLPPHQDIKEDLSLLDQTPWGLLLTDPAHKHYSVSFSFHDSEHEDGLKYFDVQVISDLKKKLDEFIKVEEPNVSYELSGQAAFRWHFHKIISRDAIFNLGILLLFLIFFRVFYGTWKSGFLFLFTLFYTVLALYGLLGWFGFPLDLLTNNLFLMTAIAGVADFLFVTSAQEDSDWQESFRTIILPGFLTTFTTLVGFWSLMISDFSIIQRFGFAAGCGALLEWTSTFIVLPALLQSFNFKGKWIDLKKAWRPAWLLHSTELKPKRKVTIAACSLLLLSVWAGMNLNFSDTPTQNFPEKHELRTAFKNLHDARGWESSLYVVFSPEAKRSDQERILNKLQEEEQVVWIESALGFEKFLTGNLPETEKTLVMNQVKSTAFNKRYWQSDGTTRAMILLRSSSVEELTLISGKISTLCNSLCSPVGQNEVFREYSTRISSTLAESFLISLLIVLCTLFILARSRGFKNYLAIAVSVLWGPLIMIVVLWLFQIPISIVTSVFLAVIVGLTGDNAIQYIFGGQDLKQGIQKRAFASVLLGLLLCLASLAFIGQTLIPVKVLGILFFLGFLATLFGDLWALKGLLSISERNNKF